MTTTTAERHAPESDVIHPLWVRATHWINALAMLVMIGSGWQIYNASPLFAFSFPEAITLGIVTGRFRRKLFPIWPRQLIADIKAALAFKLAHDDLSVYNAVQKLLYLGVIAAGIVLVLSGLSIWKPVQLQYLTALFGGYDIARYVHFVCMALIVAFLVVHVALALLVPKSLRAMIIGR